MKLAVFTAMAPEYTPREIVGVLSHMGYDGIEWRVQHIDPTYASEAPSFWRNNRCTIEVDTILERAEEVRELGTAVGLEVCALASYLELHEHSRIEHVVRAAQTLGATMVRVHVPRFDGSRSYRELFRGAREQLTSLQHLSRAHGVRLLIETHGRSITPSASAAFRLVEGLDPDCVGVIYDPANMLSEGYEPWRMGVELLGEYLAHVHVKGLRRRKDGEEGAPRLSWKEILQELRVVGYDGYLSLEDFSRGSTTDEKMGFAVTHVRSLLSELG